ncbi:MAG: DUF2325 domain-containing protein [Euryarchaeota archaeon]|nr:DUF2325 domain-containing protein [Euryarchaeota archaeon]
MKAILIGGMERLKVDYIKIFAEFGIEVEIFNRWKGNMEHRLRGADLVMVFTSMVSTNMARKAVATARSRGVPVVRLHRHSLSSLRRCLRSLGEGALLEKCRGCSSRYGCETYGYLAFRRDN